MKILVQGEFKDIFIIKVKESYNFILNLLKPSLAKYFSLNSRYLDKVIISRLFIHIFKLLVTHRTY